MRRVYLPKAAAVGYAEKALAPAIVTVCVRLSVIVVLTCPTFATRTAPPAARPHFADGKTRYKGLFTIVLPLRLRTLPMHFRWRVAERVCRTAWVRPAEMMVVGGFAVCVQSVNHVLFGGPARWNACPIAQGKRAVQTGAVGLAGSVLEALPVMRWETVSAPRIAWVSSAVMTVVAMCVAHVPLAFRVG